MGDLVELLQLIDLMFYGFCLSIGLLFIFITALAAVGVSVVGVWQRFLQKTVIRQLLPIINV